MGQHVTVIGAGVVGLTCAIDLLERGHRVDVVADRIDGIESSVAAALWAVPFVEQSDRTRTWAYQTLARLRRDGSADDGIREQLCRIVGLTASAGDPWTRGFTPPIRQAAPHELPHGFGAGTISSIPLIDASRFLAHLRARVEGLGGRLRRAHVDSLTAGHPHGAIIVNAAGLGAAVLAEDPSVRPVRSQIVRVTNPGLEMTTIVREGPLAPLFIVPRFSDVVIGGPADSGAYDPVADGSLEEELLMRARLVEPALAEATVLSRAVGHRPVRDAVRLEAEERDGRRIVHCYGHGGAGYALAWGTAAAVADLVEGAA